MKTTPRIFALFLAMVMVVTMLPMGALADVLVDYRPETGLTNAEAAEGIHYALVNGQYVPVTVETEGSDTSVYQDANGKTYADSEISTKWKAKNGRIFTAKSPFVTATLKTYTRTHSGILGMYRFWYVNDADKKDTTSAASSAKGAREKFKAAKEFRDDGAPGSINKDDPYYVAAVYTSVTRKTVQSVTYTYYAAGRQLATSKGAATRCPVTLYAAVAHVHSYTGTVTAPTCTKDGYTTYTCACGDSYIDNVIPAAHRYTTSVTAPTCTEQGYTTFTCTVCGDTYKDAFTQAKGHALTGTKVAPTCTEGGYTLRECSRCDYTDMVDFTEATGHAYKETVVTPTKTEGGYTLHTCTACGDFYITDETDPLPAELVSGTFTVASMNVDGLPTKLIGITLNGDGPGSDGTKAISKAIAARNWDFFAVSEDFNYHTELMSSLTQYKAGTHRGKVSWLTNNTDGLDLIWKKSLTVTGEKWTAWKDNYSTGIFNTGNGADKMINKGFRFYQVAMNKDVTVDVYILHMDADSDPGDIAARESQLRQLAAAIKATRNGNPIIVMGDTNCRYTRERLQEIFVNGLNADKRFTVTDPWVKLAWNGVFPTYNTDSIMAIDKGGPFPYPQAEIVDKMFVINNADSNVTLTVNSYTVDTTFVNANGQPLADHWPIVVQLGYTAVK